MSFVTKGDERFVRLVNAVKHLEYLRAGDQRHYHKLQQTCSKKDAEIHLLKDGNLFASLEKDIAYLDGALKGADDTIQDRNRQIQRLEFLLAKANRGTCNE